MAQKKRPSSAKSTARKSPDPRKQGMRAFSANSFDAAIGIWSTIKPRDAVLTAALAEATFRRGLMKVQPKDRLADMAEAHKLQPDEPRYRYHLGLALQLAGELVEASEVYRGLLEKHPTWPGVGLVLALAELERNPQADLSGLPVYDEHIADLLGPAQTILKGQVYTPEPDRASQSLHQLWQGISLIERDPQAATALLKQATPLSMPMLNALRLYYEGLAAVRLEDTATALANWQRAAEATSQMPPWFENNLIALLVPYLEGLLEASDYDGLIKCVEWLRRNPIYHAALAPLHVQALDRIAQHKADQGQWQEAILQWEMARQLVASSNALGSPRRLLHNLAIGYEMLEEWVAAAEMWRAMMRTRPRKARADAADDPLAYSDEQWTWIRRRIITCYQKAGEPGEAVKVFRQAIKTEPDDLDLRLQLADALLANEQEQASVNELNRILERDEKNVGAHLKLAEIYSSSDIYFWNGTALAERSLRIVLEQQPEREDVRRQVARTILVRGNRMHNFGMMEQARAIFEEGRQFAPENYQFPLNLARLAHDGGERELIEPLLKQVLELANDDSSAYIQAIELWVVAGEIDQAYKVLVEAREQLTLDVEFYIDLSATILAHTSRRRLGPLGSLQQGSVPENPAQTEFVRELLDMAAATDPENPQVRFELAADLMSFNPALALEQVEAGIALNPDDPNGLTLLGMLQGLNGQKKEARATLRKAARLARQQDKHEVANQADMIRDQVDNLEMAFRMGGLFGNSFGDPFGDPFDPFGDPFDDDDYL